jgi:hypothetical protein
VNWRPELKGEELALAWKYAAGVNPDGRPKNAAQHKCRRTTIKRNLKCLEKTTTVEKTDAAMCNQ